MDPAPASELWKLLAGSGAMGAVVYMLLTRINPKLDEIQRRHEEQMDRQNARLMAWEAAQDRNATATSLRLIATPHILPEIKERASQIIEDATLAEKGRDAS